jgi:hypothetical protein
MKILGNNGCASKRPITINPVILKVFEYCIMGLFFICISSEMCVSIVSNQIHDYANAIFALRTVCDYFNNRGSNMFIASLDASHAFAMVDHAKTIIITSSQKSTVMFCPHND